MARFKGIANRNLPACLDGRRLIAAHGDELIALDYPTAAVPDPRQIMRTEFTCVITGA
jgi:hypothetical protein